MRSGSESHEAMGERGAAMVEAATGSVTLRGRWEDPVDDPAQPAPTTRIRRAVLGTDDGAVRGRAAGATSDEESVLPAGASFDLLGEREMWRVEAGRGAVRSCDETGDSGDLGVFELSYDTSDGRWLPVGCDD